VEANFFACLRERGKIVPGSRREGHNVFTNTGRNNLTKLINWAMIDDANDTADSQARVRWIGVGSGTQLEVKEVLSLNSPLEVTTAPSVFIVPVEHLKTVFFTTTSVRYAKEYGTGDLSFGGPVTLTESALYMDVDATLDTAVGTHKPSFYKTFEGLVKTPEFTLEITWELKF